MEPKIREFSSKMFYHSDIKDAESIMHREKPNSINIIGKHFPDLMFIDIKDSEEKKHNTSLSNS